MRHGIVVISRIVTIPYLSITLLPGVICVIVRMFRLIIEEKTKIKHTVAALIVSYFKSFQLHHLLTFIPSYYPIFLRIDIYSHYPTLDLTIPNYSTNTIIHLSIDNYSWHKPLNPPPSSFRYTGKGVDEMVFA